MDFEFPNKKKSFGPVVSTASTIPIPKSSNDKTISQDIILESETILKPSSESNKVDGSDKEKDKEKEKDKIITESNISDHEPNKNLEQMRKTKSMKTAMLSNQTLSPSCFVKEPSHVLLEMSKHYGIKRAEHEFALRQDIDYSKSKPNSHTHAHTNNYNYIAHSSNDSSQYNYECWKTNQIQNQYLYQSQPQPEYNHDYSFIDVGISRIGPPIPYAPHPNNHNNNNNMMCDEYAIPTYMSPNNLYNR